MKVVVLQQFLDTVFVGVTTTNLWVNSKLPAQRREYQICSLMQTTLFLYWQFLLRTMTVMMLPYPLQQVSINYSYVRRIFDSVLLLLQNIIS